MSQNLMLIVPRDWDLNVIQSIVEKVAPCYRYDDAETKELQVKPDSGDWYVRFHDYDQGSDIVDEYMADEDLAEDIRRRISESAFVGVEYDDYAQMRRLLGLVVRREGVLVDTMHGEVLFG